MQKNTMSAYKNLSIKQNVSFRVIDEATGKVVQEHIGHNTATNSLLFGIAHHLVGDFLPNETHGLNPGYPTLSNYVPRYISLGTMGLINQDQDANGLPAGIGDTVIDSEDPEYIRLQEEMNAAKAAWDAAKEALARDCQYWPACDACAECQECATRIGAKQQAVVDAKAAYDAAYQAFMTYNEETRFVEYMKKRPGYGADGYDINENNGRKYLGLGYAYTSYDNTEQYIKNDIVTYSGTLYRCLQNTSTPCGPFNPDVWEALPDPYQPSIGTTIQLELISPSFPRQSIAYRDIVPEYQAELPKTIDVIFSAMISTGALKQFRPEGQDYIFITEAGLWSKKTWEDSGENGLLAGYRIVPPNDDNWDMTVPENREILKRNVLKVGRNQVVQVVWKVQIGTLEKFDSDEPAPDTWTKLQFSVVDSNTHDILSDAVVRITVDAEGTMTAHDAKTRRPLIWTTTDVIKNAYLNDGTYYMWEDTPSPGYQSSDCVAFELMDGVVTKISTAGIVEGTSIIMVNEPVEIVPDVVYFTTEDSISALSSARSAEGQPFNLRFYPLFVDEDGELSYYEINRSNLPTFARNVDVVPEFRKFNATRSGGTTPAQFKELATVIPSDDPDYPIYYYQGCYYSDAKSIGFDNDSALRAIVALLNGTCEYISFRNMDVTNVTSLGGLFFQPIGTTNPHPYKSLDFTGWNTSNITSLGGAFVQTFYIECLLGLENWNTSNVTEMNDLFAWLGRNSPYNNGYTFADISSWDTSKVTNLSRAFYGCYIEPPANWNTSNVTAMRSTLGGYAPNLHDGPPELQEMTHSPVEHCRGIKWLNWDTSKVQYFSHIYDGAGWFNENWDEAPYDTGCLYLIKDIDTSSATDISNMFSKFNYCPIYTGEGVPDPTDTAHIIFTSQVIADYVSTFDTSNVTTMDGVFNHRTVSPYVEWYSARQQNLPTADLTHWNVSKVTTASYMFADCDAYPPFSIDTDGLEFTALEDASSMFESTRGDDILNASPIKSTSLRDLTNMFKDSTDNLCSTIFNEFTDLSTVTTMSGTFEGCTTAASYVGAGGALSHADLSSLETASDIIDASNISTIELPSTIDFRKCQLSMNENESSSSITLILDDLHVQNTNAYYRVRNMLRDTPHITTIKFRDWDVDSPSMRELFSYCTDLTSVDLSRWDVTPVTDFSQMFRKYDQSGNGVLDYSSLDSWTNLHESASFLEMCAGTLSKDASVDSQGNTYRPYEQDYRFPQWQGIQGTWKTDNLQKVQYSDGQTTYQANSFGPIESGGTPNRIPPQYACSFEKTIGPTYTYDWDFTQSLTDAKGIDATFFTDPDLASTLTTTPASGQYVSGQGIKIGSGYYALHIPVDLVSSVTSYTVELDIADGTLTWASWNSGFIRAVTAQSGENAVFSGLNSDFGVFTIDSYDSNGDFHSAESSITSQTFFSNCTLKIVNRLDGNNVVWDLYKDDTLVMTAGSSSEAMFWDNSVIQNPFAISGGDGQFIGTITGMRIYENESPV